MAQRRGFGDNWRRPRNRWGTEAQGARSGILQSKPQRQPQLRLLIASLGPQRKVVRPGWSKSAHCFLRGQQQRRGVGTAAGPGAGRACRRRAGAGEGSAARGCPLVDLGRHGTAASTERPGGRGRGGDWQTQAREPGQALCFSRSAPGQGNPACLLVGIGFWKVGRKVSCTSACTALFGSQQTVK